MWWVNNNLLTRPLLSRIGPNNKSSNGKSAAETGVRNYFHSRLGTSYSFSTNTLFPSLIKYTCPGWAPGTSGRRGRHLRMWVPLTVHLLRDHTIPRNHGKNMYSTKTNSKREISWNRKKIIEAVDHSNRREQQVLRTTPSETFTGSEMGEALAEQSRQCVQIRSGPSGVCLDSQSENMSGYFLDSPKQARVSRFEEIRVE